MRLSDLNGLPAERLQRAMIAAGVTMTEDEEEVLFRGDSPAATMLRTLMVGWLGNIELTDEQADAVIAVAAAAFCLGCAYESVAGGPIL